MKKQNLISIAFFSKIIILFCLPFLSCNFASGSYPFAERFEINAPEISVIEAVNSFKKNNPIFIVPENYGFFDGKTKPNEHWFHLYFYNIDKNEIYYCWTRPKTKKITTFALISVKINDSKWLDINHDLSDDANKKIIDYFSKNILSKIKAYIKY